MAKAPALPPRQAAPKVRYGLQNKVKQVGWGNIACDPAEVAALCYDANQQLVGDMFATEKGPVDLHCAFIALLLVLGEQRYGSL